MNNINLMQFPQFLQTMRGQNPNQIISQMLQSGRLSQQQLNQAQMMAQQIAPQFEQFRGMMK